MATEPTTETQPDALSIAEGVVDRSVALAGRLLDEVERRCGDLEHATVRDLQTLSGLVSKLQRALAAIVKEQRALLKDGKARATEMTRGEKLALLIEVFPSLPGDERRDILGKLRQADRAAGGYVASRRAQ